MNKILTKQDYDLLQSKTFNWLRFPLIFFILFIHTIRLYDNCLESIFCANVGYLFREILARVGVPFFFIVSGYYFFYTKNAEELHFTKEVYISKLRKRVNTLLIPYLLWNLFCILYYFGAPYVGLANKSILSFVDFLRGFFAQGDMLPADYPLWYVRDLMFLCILSPIIYLFIKYLRVVAILVCAIPFMLNLDFGVENNNVVQQSIFFFPLGAYFAIEGKNIVYYCRKIKWAVPLYVFLIVADLIMKNVYLNRFGIIVGLIALFNVVSYFVENNKLKENKFLSDASFFIFAFHGLPLMILVSRMTAILPHTDWAYVLIFFSSVIIVALLGLGIYVFLKRFFPRFTSVITGGR